MPWCFPPCSILILFIESIYFLCQLLAKLSKAPPFMSSHVVATDLFFNFSPSCTWLTMISLSVDPRIAFSTLSSAALMVLSVLWLNSVHRFIFTVLMTELAGPQRRNFSLYFIQVFNSIWRAHSELPLGPL